MPRRLLHPPVPFLALLAAACAASLPSGVPAKGGTAVGGPVDFEARASHAYVLAGDPGEVYLHLAIGGSEAVEVPRLPMDLALVLDRSGSMASQDKLEFAKRAAEELAARLSPGDRLALVAYDDVVQTLVPTTPAAQRERFASAIRALEPGGRTDLHGGLVAGGRELLRHLDERRLQRVLLISDGLANVGVTDREAIAARARRFAERGVQVSAMGVGVDYDEVLLDAIAARGGGSYAYIDHPEGIGRRLERELRELGSTVARDAVVTVELGPGVELLEVYGYAFESRGRTITVRVNDLSAGEEKRLVLRLAVPSTGRGEARLAEASIEYRDAATNARFVQRTRALSARFTRRPELVERGRDLDVLAHAAVVRNAMALRTAMAHQKQGRFEAAKEHLLERCAAVDEGGLQSAELDRLRSRMENLVTEIDRTAHDRWARRDLQLGTELQALGYLGD